VGVLRKPWQLTEGHDRMEEVVVKLGALLEGTCQSRVNERAKCLVREQRKFAKGQRARGFSGEVAELDGVMVGPVR
jgi:hypothetical protein